MGTARYRAKPRHRLLQTGFRTGRRATVPAAVAVAVLLLLQAAAPTAGAGETGRQIGESLEGRAIVAHTLGDGPVRVAIIGGLHTGREEESVHIVDKLLAHFGENPTDIPERVSLSFVPKANPDGYERRTRVNARGVDLNRNWPTEDWQPKARHGEQEVDAGNAPLSEPETEALYDYLMKIVPDYVLSYHGYAALVDHNGTGRAGELSRLYADTVGFELIEGWPYYPITGEFIEAMAEEGIAAADVELREDDPEAFARHLEGVRAVLAAIAR